MNELETAAAGVTIRPLRPQEAAAAAAAARAALEELYPEELSP
jgi:hypothetical protein